MAMLRVVFNHYRGWKWLQYYWLRTFLNPPKSSSAHLQTCPYLQNAPCIFDHIQHLQYGLHFLPGSNFAPFESVKVPVSKSAEFFQNCVHILYVREYCVFTKLFMGTRYSKISNFGYLVPEITENALFWGLNPWRSPPRENTAIQCLIKYDKPGIIPNALTSQTVVNNFCFAKMYTCTCTFNILEITCNAKI